MLCHRYAVFAHILLRTFFKEITTTGAMSFLQRSNNIFKKPLFNRSPQSCILIFPLFQNIVKFEMNTKAMLHS